MSVVSDEDCGDWNSAVPDGPADPHKLEIQSSFLSYCGMFWNLSQDLGQKVPIKLQASVVKDAIEYRFSIGCDVSYWRAMSEKKKWEVVYLLCHGDLLNEWEWAASWTGCRKLPK